jgi:hypothetical protein
VSIENEIKELEDVTGAEDILSDCGIKDVAESLADNRLSGILSAEQLLLEDNATDVVKRSEPTFAKRLTYLMFGR